MTRRLIEHGLPLAQINAESSRDKSLRHGHLSTLHLWWARRPLPMSRAIVFGTLVPDPDDDDGRRALFRDIAAGCGFDQSSSSLVGKLREHIHRAWPDRPPKVLDCFGGGGAIPLEALRLGADVTATDLNPVATLLLRGALVYPQQFGTSDSQGNNTLVADFMHWADWVAKRTEERVRALFPASDDGKRPAVYFWVRTLPCQNPACRVEIPLIRSQWLAKDRRTAWVDIVPDGDTVKLEVRSSAPPEDRDLDGVMRGSSAVCPACGSTIAANEVRRYAQEHGFGHRLFAVCDIDDRERTYRAPRTPEADGVLQRAEDMTDNLPVTSDGLTPVPDERMAASQYRTLRNLIYGVDSFAGLFNPRQLYALGALASSVREAHDAMLADGMDPDRARAVATYLAFAVDRVADYDSTFTTWRPGAEAPRGTFPQQSIRMAWDYVEIDPLGEGPSNWDGAVDWIRRVIEHCSTTGSTLARVDRADAQSLPFDDDTFDAVIIDPPYYDAFQYADLSDFFYVWLKRTVGSLYPDLFAVPLTPKRQEIIENRADKKSDDYVSPEEYERRLRNALDEIRRVVRDDGVVALVFAHTDVTAWELLLSALRAAGLLVTTSWPMRSERASRNTAHISAVLDSSVVLICRAAPSGREGFYDDVVSDLRARIRQRLADFEHLDLVGADYFISAIGPAFEVFAQYDRVLRLSGDEVGVDDLMVLARRTVAEHAMAKLLGGQSLGGLDDPTLFYLTWRWSYGIAALPADETYMLERAFEVDLDELARPGGFVEKKGSSFHLMGPQERDRIDVSSAGVALVDVMHRAAQLWDAGRRNELAQLLAVTHADDEPAFWSAATALTQILPDGDRERTMLLGLTGNRAELQSAAKDAAPQRAEALTLFQSLREPCS